MKGNIKFTLQTLFKDFLLLVETLRDPPDVPEENSCRNISLGPVAELQNHIKPELLQYSKSLITDDDEQTRCNRLNHFHQTANS